MKHIKKVMVVGSRVLVFIGFLVMLSQLGTSVASAQATCPGACLSSSSPCPSGSTANYSITCPGTNQVCCVASGGSGTPPPGGGGSGTPPPGGGGSGTPPPAGGSASIISVQITNPLNYNTVNDLLGQTLTFLQGFIVVLALIFIIIGALLYITSGGDSGRVETAKKCITYALIGLAIGIAAPAFLRQISEILGWTSAPAPPAGVGTSLTLLEIASRILNFLLSVVGVIAIIMLVVGGFMYLTAAGDEDRIDTGKKIVKYSIIGITVALAAMVLVRQIANFF